MDKSELSEVILQIMPERRDNGKFHFILLRGNNELFPLTGEYSIFTKSIPVINSYRLFLLRNKKVKVPEFLYARPGIEQLTIFNGTFLKICEYGNERNMGIAGINLTGADGSVINILYRDGTTIDLDTINNFRSRAYRINHIVIRGEETEICLKKDFSMEAFGRRQEVSKIISEIVYEALSLSMEAFERIGKCVFKKGGSIEERPVPVRFLISDRHAWDLFLSSKLITWRSKISGGSEMVIFRRGDSQNLVRAFMEDNKISIFPMASTSIGMIGKLAEEIEDMGGVFIA